MEPIFAETVTQIKGKWETVSLHSRLPVFERADHPISLCYQRGRDALERYIREQLLPELEAVPEEERRRYRLHCRENRMTYLVTGTLIKDEYLSLTLTVGKSDGHGFAQTKSLRVWNVERECLCPIDLFLPRTLAKDCHRWEFALEEDRLWAILKAGGEGKWIEWKRRL